VCRRCSGLRVVSCQVVATSPGCDAVAVARWAGGSLVQVALCPVAGETCARPAPEGHGPLACTPSLTGHGQGLDACSCVPAMGKGDDGVLWKLLSVSGARQATPSEEGQER
jgi:hypothetical protein